MENKNYFDIAVLENTNWWYLGRRDLLDKILLSTKRKYHNALDLGCGIGTNYELISKYSNNVFGIDISEIAIQFCKQKNYKELYLSDINELKMHNKFDLIVCMDVLEHIENDINALKKIKSLMLPGGMLFISVPAHKYLWNNNDLFSKHIRRYNIKEIKDKISNCNLAIIIISYWNQFMFIPFLIYKIIMFNNKTYKARNNLTIIPEKLNILLYWIIQKENKMILKGYIKNGVSIICLAQNNY